jgi:hypothetical protein
MDVVDKDLGFKDFLEEIKKYKNAYIEVGLRSEPTNGSPTVNDKGVNIAEYAAANEYGVLGKIPARSFIGSTIDENNEVYNAIIVDGIKKVGEGVTANTHLTKLGIKVQSDIKVKIGSNILPPNAPSTIYKKTKGKGGNTTTLIDTGTMRNAVSYKVFI